MVLSHGWCWTASRLEWEPTWGDSLLFTTEFPEIAGTHFLSTSEGQQDKYLNLIQRNKRVSVVVKMLFPQVD